MFTAEQLLTLIDGLGGIVWEADPRTFQFSFVSAEAERVLGYPAASWLEADFWTRHTHPDDVARCTRFCMDAIAEGRDHVFDYRMIAADGRVVWLRDMVSVRRVPGDKTRLFGIALDVTREKEEEAEKLRLSRLYAALIENSSDNISLLRADGSTLFQSPAIEQQLGYAPEELIGRRNMDLIHPDDRPAAEQRFLEMLRSDKAVGPLHFRLRHKDGSWRVLESFGKRVTAEDGQPLVVVNSRDITVVVQVQEALESTQEQLTQAMKMEAVGRLAGGVAHDFNNLLTVISGYAELIGATLDASDSRAEDIEEIKRAAHRATLLTRQLLAFSRRQVLRPEVLDLNAVVREVSVLIRRLIGEDVRLELETWTSPVPVLIDRSQIEQVLMNLAVNARDAMPLGGALTMRTTIQESSAWLEVSDTGSGIPQALLGRIFEPFFTTKETGKGTGLGLSTAYGIVKQSGGDIEVRSEVGEGATFRISLPLAAEPGDHETGESPEIPGGTDTILLVEDEGQVRELVDQALTRLGYTVLVAVDGAGAVELCKLHRQRIALLLTDVVMPNLSGPEVFRRVSMLVPGIAVLYMSGYTGDRVLARGVSEEGIAFLQKPFTPAMLARKVREVLDSAGDARRTG